MKKIVSILIYSLLCISLLGGCKSSVILDTTSLQTDISRLQVAPEIQIVGLGEASQGVSEYQKMKAQVFKALVHNNDCRTFIIEGDFGGSLKVEKYIHTGGGSVQDVLKEIGFAIYRTQEMADLVDWMRSYNDSAAEGQDLHYYGMDMQRFDNNKAYLFDVLDQADLSLSQEYKLRFAGLTDNSRLKLDCQALEQAKTDALALMKAMQANRTAIIAAVGQEKYDFALRCVQCIYEASNITNSGNQYNIVRDRAMADAVAWFVEHADGSLLFINGHNGHIGKVSAYGFDVLGSHLARLYGSAYFAIGSDAQRTSFNSQTDQGFTEVKVKNRNPINTQLYEIDSDYYYLNFAGVSTDSAWQSILTTKKSFTTLNVGIQNWQVLIPFFYTQTLVPAKTYDAMLVFQEVSPTHILE